MDLSNLTQDQIARAQECTTADELLAFVREEGVELTDEQLEMVSGGGVSDWFPGDVDGKIIWKNLPIIGMH